MDNNYSTKIINSNVSFKGHTLATNAKGDKEYKFYLPTTNDKNVSLEVVALDKNGEAKNLSKALVKGNSTVPVWTLPVSSVYDKDTKIAYRFIDKNGNPILDNTLKTNINGQNFNEAIRMTRPAFELPKQIMHMTPDNFKPNDGVIMVDEYGHEIQRNHFNKFGGKLQDIIKSLGDIKKNGAKRILSTPIFGNDVLSNHGYWTVNPYQITSSLGNINDFKKLQVELMKNGMGWISDGAYANEGIEGTHLQDIVRWGKNDSPFAQWFDLKDMDMNGLGFGVLPPVDRESSKYYDFKIINSPRIYSFDKDGKPTKDFGKINPNYNKNRPTYVQQFDRRLMDENYINSPEKLSEYSKKQLENVYGIRDYKDSVQLYSNSVSPEIVDEKIKAIKDAAAKTGNPEATTHSLYRDMMKNWETFSTTNVDKDSAIRTWVGKNDIFALNYLNKDVQDFTINSAKYWTNETDKIFTSYIGKMLADGKTDLAKTIKNIGKLYDVNLKDDEVKNIINGTYTVQLSPAGSSIKDELKEFPLVASEVPNEIGALLSDKAVTNGKELDKTYAKHIAPMVENILQKSYPETFKAGALTEDGKNLFRLVSSDIMRYVSAYALSGEAPKVEKADGFTQINLPKDFSNKVFDNVNYQSATRQESLNKVLRTFDEGAENLKSDKKALADVETIIHNTLDGIDFSKIKMAKSIMTKLDIGMDFRIDALKDIMDLDKIRQNKSNPELTWATDKDVWTKFVAGIREYNPKAYIIGEITDLGLYFKNPNLEKELLTDSGLTTPTNYCYIFNILNRIVHGAPEAAYDGPLHVNLTSNIDGDYTLSSALSSFFDSGSADTIRYSHEAVGNHDKPRALHGYALNIKDFIYRDKPGENECNALAEAFNDALNSTQSALNLTNEQKQKLSDSMTNLSKGMVENGFDKSVKDNFRVRPFNYTIEEFVKNADLGLGKDETEKLSATIHNEMLKPAFSKFKSMFEVLVALPGNPTLYAGDNFGETGFEMPSNNVYQQNRNQIHRDWTKDSNRKDFGIFKNEMEKILNLRNKKELEPLVNGDTVVFNQFNPEILSGDNVDVKNIGGVYRYNQKSDVISVFNTNHLDNTRSAAYAGEAKLKEIPVKFDFDITNAFGTNEFVRINKAGERVDDGVYKIVDNALKRFKNADCKEALDIELKDVATYFVRNLKYETVQAVETAVGKVSKKAPAAVEEAKVEVETATKEAEKTMLQRVKSPVVIGAVASAGILAGILHLNKKSKTAEPAKPLNINA